MEFIYGATELFLQFEFTKADEMQINLVGKVLNHSQFLISQNYPSFVFSYGLFREKDCGSEIWRDVFEMNVVCQMFLVLKCSMEMRPLCYLLPLEAAFQFCRLRPA